MLVRGLFRRCPWCGGRGAFFDGWFKKSKACHSCGLEWRRDDVGFELGAAAIAMIICLGPLVVALGITVAITWPEMEIVPMLIVLGAGAVILPLLLNPSSYTIWQAVDILMRPVEPEHFVGTVEGTDTPGASETSAPGSATGRTDNAG